jgi:hypothetical protein
MEKIRIRDKHPGSATLLESKLLLTEEGHKRQDKMKPRSDKIKFHQERQKKKKIRKINDRAGTEILDCTRKYT